MNPECHIAFDSYVTNRIGYDPFSDEFYAVYPLNIVNERRFFLLQRQRQCVNYKVFLKTGSVGGFANYFEENPRLLGESSIASIRH